MMNSNLIFCSLIIPIIILYIKTYNKRCKKKINTHHHNCNQKLKCQNNSQKKEYQLNCKKDKCDYPAVEQLIFEIPSNKLESFFIADANTWTPFLASVPGYVDKIQTYNSSEVNGDGNVKVNLLIFWKSYESWKNIKNDDLKKTQKAFVSQFGSEPIPKAIPGNDGWRIYQNNCLPFSIESKNIRKKKLQIQ